MSKNHWAVLTLSYEHTATGLKVICESDVPCHLYMRWSLTRPVIHLVPIFIRGVWQRSSPRICFVSYHDNQQAEAGDTLIHTFTKEPWPFCETRFFYFYGSISGISSPSTTAYFEKHNEPAPLTVTFQPDAHPEVTSVDGYVFRFVPYGGNTWNNIHDSIGTGAYDQAAEMHVQISALGSYSNKWEAICRAPILFDTTSILPQYQIISAKINVYCRRKTNDLNINFAVAIFTSSPSSNTAIQAHDYQHFDNILLSPKLLYANTHTGQYNELILTSTGLSAIQKGGITKLALREANYDSPNILPPWSPALSEIVFESADGGLSPQLVVTYQPS